ncbi:hypothetical protein AB0I27_23070 [Streptomyces sp. NPDC050597]|uniref:hypothetical protein n=1 Tax=Streptomyces sp. NPDC050597 TaxID=3157212 RepID=UPI00341A3124
MKARVRANVEAERALPARDRILAILSAVRTHGEAEAMLAEVEAEREAQVRGEIAKDFIRQGEASNTLSWGQAHEIALNGLCGCSGGIKPCDMGGAR